MTIKDRLPSPPPDKAAHFVYGAPAAVIGSVICIAASFFSSQPIVFTLCAGAAGAILGAWSAGKLGEMLDAKSNEEADAAGSSAPRREVSNADIAWTAVAGVPVAIPLLALAAFIHYL
jgi:hypothetical protein